MDAKAINRPSEFTDGLELAVFASSKFELMLTRAVITEVESAASANRIEPARTSGASAPATLVLLESFTL